MKPRIVVIIVVLILAVLGGYRLLKHWHQAPQPTSASAMTTQYHCPMHPQYTSDKPGDCPICGMRLVKSEQQQSTEGVAPAERKILYYADAMNPTLHFDKPGKASDGMDLVPVYAEDAVTSSSIPVPGYAPVKVSAEQEGRMGIVVDAAKLMPLERTILTVGRVTYDERKLFHIHTKFDAYIEDLYVNFVGQAVKQGDPLFSVYSPELLSTENEYLLALRGKRQSTVLHDGDSSAGSELVSAAKQRLTLWDVGPDEIARLDKTGKASTTIVIRSPVNGFVTAMTARHGMRITPTDTVYDIADLSIVWVLADIYEMDLPFVHTGQSAEVSLVADP